jgi:hypothetical protein
MITEERKQKIKSIVKSLISKSMKEILDENKIKLYYKSLKNIEEGKNVS